MTFGDLDKENGSEVETELGSFIALLAQELFKEPEQSLEASSLSLAM